MAVHASVSEVKLTRNVFRFHEKIQVLESA